MAVPPASVALHPCQTGTQNKTEDKENIKEEGSLTPIPPLELEAPSEDRKPAKKPRAKKEPPKKRWTDEDAIMMWVDAGVTYDDAAGYLEVRHEKKCPNTERACKIIAKRLRSFHDPIASIQQATVKGWKTVYETEKVQDDTPARLSRLADRLVAKQNGMVSGEDRNPSQALRIVSSGGDGGEGRDVRRLADRSKAVPAGSH